MYMMSQAFNNHVNDITFWINNVISQPNADCNNLPTCPYAKNSLLRNRIVFSNGLTDIEQYTANWDLTKDAVIFILDDDIDPDLATMINSNLNEKFFNEDFVFFLDHKDILDMINKTPVNNGTCNFIVMQKRSKLLEATYKIEKLGYYRNWSKEEYNEAILWKKTLVI
jgi:hypothetical protein